MRAEINKRTGQNKCTGKNLPYFSIVEHPGRND